MARPRRSWSSSGRPGCATTSGRCAARWRRQAVVLGDGTDADVVAFAEDELEAAVQVFHVRGGRVRGQRGWVIDKVGAHRDRASSSSASSPSSTASRRRWPRRRTTPASRCRGRSSCRSCRPTSDALAEWLSALRGSRVSSGCRSAATSGRWRDRRAQRRARPSPSTSCAAPATSRRARRRWQEIQDALGLDTAPLRIECVDVSHVQGTDVVASLVVFEDGLARKSEYRRFEIRGVRRAATSPRSPRSSAGGSAATSRSGRSTTRRSRRRPRGVHRPPHEDRDARPDTTARPGSTRRPAGRAGSPTRRTCSSSTAARRRSRRPRTCWPSSASPTSPCAAWPSALRRSGCRPSPTR